MPDVLSVSIYRNEYDHSDPAGNCIISLQPASNRIALKSNPGQDPCNATESVVYDSGLRDSIGYALRQWLNDGQPLCTSAMRFNNAEAFRQWRRSVWFEDCDVSWHVVLELKGGEIISFVCVGQYPFPCELAEIFREVIERRKHSAARKVVN